MALPVKAEENELKPSRPRRRWLKGCMWGCVWGCGGMILLLLLPLLAFCFLIRGRVPKSYPLLATPMAPPLRSDYDAFELDGAESPYLGHTGSWDGKGGTMGGGSKRADLDKEVTMGLRWTFMEVRWRALEPQGPVDLAGGIPPAWQELDAYVIEAHKHRLNILMQAVIGGNAGGPPGWAGRREPGKSAPADIKAAAAFAGKLAARYAPGGTLATQQGWGRQFGVRAWELDNEPESYRTHWKGQAGDYAEFATQAAAQIRQADTRAVIVLPGSASGHAAQWIEALLDAHALAGSPEYRRRGVPYSIGPIADVISFHLYEGMDGVFAGKDRTIERVFSEIRKVVEKWETGAAGFHYPRKREYWHTEGNYAFIFGAISAPRRAAWRMQFFTRAFAAGIRKVCVMDASDPEQIAVRNYIDALPWPFPMQPADDAVKILRGRVRAFRHLDDATPEHGQVCVLWAEAGTGDAEAEVPITHDSVTLVQVDGTKRTQSAPERRIRVKLKGDEKMAPPVLIIDRPEGQSTPAASIMKEKRS